MQIEAADKRSKHNRVDTEKKIKIQFERSKRVNEEVETKTKKYGKHWEIQFNFWATMSVDL